MKCYICDKEKGGLHICVPCYKAMKDEIEQLENEIFVYNEELSDALTKILQLETPQSSDKAS